MSDIRNFAPEFADGQADADPDLVPFGPVLYGNCGDATWPDVPDWVRDDPDHFRAINNGGTPVEGEIYPGIEAAACPDGKVQVSIYAVDRCYGGREEGGWYYDWYTFAGVSSRVFPGDVEATQTELLKLFEGEQPRYPLSSVLSDGPEYHAVVEAIAARGESKVRPHYE